MISFILLLLLPTLRYLTENGFESCFIKLCEAKTSHKGATQFGITSSYDEYLLFKSSAAYTAMKYGNQ